MKAAQGIRQKLNALSWLTEFAFQARNYLTFQVSSTNEASYTQEVHKTNVLFNMLATKTEREAEHLPPNTSASFSPAQEASLSYSPGVIKTPPSF